MTVEVVPSMALLQVSTSLPKVRSQPMDPESPGTAPLVTAITLYAGQRLVHSKPLICFSFLKDLKTLRPRPHHTVFERKRYYFVPDMATVHTTTPRMISKSGSKCSPEWNDLKTVLFEYAVFLVWTAKTMLSENGDVTTTTRLGARPLNREYPR